MSNQLQLIKQKVQEYGSRNWDGALPSHVRPEHFTRIAISTISQNPELLKCDQKSLFSSLMTLAQLGLAPENVLGQGYLVPYKNIVQPIVGYRGLIQLARRSGEVSELYAYPVYDKDVFDYSFGLNRTIKHAPCKKENRGELTFVYAVVKYKDGGFDFEVMSKAEVDKIKEKSPASKSQYSPWNTSYEAMAVKTVIRKLSKRLPLSTEYQQAVAMEDRFEEQGKASYLEDGNIIDAEATVQTIADEFDPTKPQNPNQEAEDYFRNLIQENFARIKKDCGLEHDDPNALNLTLLEYFEGTLDESTMKETKKSPKQFIDKFIKFYNTGER